MKRFKVKIYDTAVGDETDPEATETFQVKANYEEEAADVALKERYTYVSWDEWDKDRFLGEFGDSDTLSHIIDACDEWGLVITVTEITN